MEHKFGFSELDIEEYAAKIETKTDQKFSQTTTIKEEIKDMGSRVGDMQSLNLFGLPLDLESRDTGKQNREMQKVI